MGQEVSETNFTAEHHEVFRDALRSETATLKRWFETGAFHCDPQHTVGLELEAWLMDADCLPAPENEAFLQAINDTDIVEELSKFNFEINAQPYCLAGDVLAGTRNELEARWSKCQKTAATLGLRTLTVGILPTVRDSMLQPEWMSENNRYHALNTEIFKRRRGKDLHIHIEGEESLEYLCDHIMLEAACTSLQTHIKINPEQGARYYNAALVAAGPLVAASANAPFLYGKKLWQETRIPAFEQATRLEGFRDLAGRNVGRTTLGPGYVRHSLFELFLENLSFETLLPEVSDTSERMPHLRLQNGTIWRWVRPILGFESDGTPHLRLEHRVMPETPPESELAFRDMSQNFYACAQHGLRAEIQWRGRRVGVHTLLLDHLVPMAREALEQEGLAEADLDEVFGNTLVPRLRSGRTGAAWQLSFIDCNGRNFQALTERYAELQATGKAVHEWVV